MLHKKSYVIELIPDENIKHPKYYTDHRYYKKNISQNPAISEEQYKELMTCHVNNTGYKVNLINTIYCNNFAKINDALNCTIKDQHFNNFKTNLETTYSPATLKYNINKKYVDWLLLYRSKPVYFKGSLDSNTFLDPNIYWRLLPLFFKAPRIMLKIFVKLMRKNHTDLDTVINDSGDTPRNLLMTHFINQNKDNSNLAEEKKKTYQLNDDKNEKDKGKKRNKTRNNTEGKIRKPFSRINQNIIN